MKKEEKKKTNRRGVVIMLVLACIMALVALSSYAGTIVGETKSDVGGPYYYNILDGTASRVGKNTVYISCTWYERFNSSISWCDMNNHVGTVTAGNGSMNMWQSPASWANYDTSWHSTSGGFYVSNVEPTASSITVGFSVGSSNSYGDDCGNMSTRYGTVSFGQWTKCTIKFDANGGKGAPKSISAWKDDSVAIPTTKPTRSGAAFAGWSKDKNAKKAEYFAGKKYSFSSDTTLYAVWDYPPTIEAPITDARNRDGNAEPAFIKDGKLIIQKGDSFTPLYYQKATDKEDGDISSKTVVISSDVNTNQAGKYHVTYQVSDSNNQKVSKTITVQVNDPPVISASSYTLYYYKGQTVSATDILRHFKADDLEDGDISDEIKIITVDGRNSNLEKIDTSAVKGYVLMIQVVDSMKGKCSKEVVIKIVEDTEADTFSKRYIAKEYVEDIDKNSKWSIGEALRKLANTLKRTEPIDRYGYKGNS